MVWKNLKHLLTKTKFLSYVAAFCILTFFLSIVAAAFVIGLAPSNFCYEVFEERNSIVIGDQVYYSNSTSCQMVTFDEYSSLSSFYRSKVILAVICIVAIVFFLPESHAKWRSFMRK